MANILITPGTTYEISDDIVIPDFTGVPIMLITEDGRPVPYGLRFRLERKTVLGTYQQLTTIEFGKVDLKWDSTLLVLTTPGTYRVVRPDITEFSTPVGLQLG